MPSRKPCGKSRQSRYQGSPRTRKSCWHWVFPHCFSASQISALDFITLLNSFFTCINKPSNHGTATKRDKRVTGEIYFHHINRTHNAPSLSLGQIRETALMNQNELRILTSRIVRQRKSHPGLHGKRLVLVPHFQTQKLFPISVCFNKRRVKGKSLCLQHSD